MNPLRDKKMKACWYREGEGKTPVTTATALPGGSGSWKARVMVLEHNNKMHLVAIVPRP